jgi:aspartate kinase
MFGALASEKINLDVISTSEITISCLIAKEDEKKAVNVVHRFFFPTEEK